MKTKIELGTDTRGNIIVVKAVNATEQEITQAKAEYFAKARKLAAERKKAMAALDAAFSMKG